MPRKKAVKREEPEELDPEVELFLDVLAKIIVRIKTDEAAGSCSVDGSSGEPPVVKRKGRSSKKAAPSAADATLPRTRS